MIDLYTAQFDEPNDTLTMRVGTSFYVGIEKLYRSDAEKLIAALQEFVNKGSQGFGERNIK